MFLIVMIMLVDDVHENDAIDIEKQRLEGVARDEILLLTTPFV